MTTKKKSGLSDLERKIIAENERLTKIINADDRGKMILELQKENEVYKDLLRTFQEHIVDVDGDEWACPLCGERAPMEIDTKNFPHASFCVLYKA